MTTAKSNVLALFDTESMSENGSWLHLNVPGTDEKAYADPDKKTKPMRIKLKGPESDTWVSFQRKAAKYQGNNDKRDNDQIKRDDAKLLASMTLDIENIPGFENNRDSLFSMFLGYRDMRLQALSHVLDRENFIGMAERE